jgi:hypothetical protein
MDEDLAELMRRTDPARTLVDERTESDIQAELRRITGQPAPVHEARHRTRWPWLAVPAVAAAVVAVAVLVQMWNPFGQTASAATPPLLVLSRTSLSVGGAMDHALSQLTATSTRESERRARLEGWYLQTEVDAQGTSASVITPQEQELVWDEDLSGTITLTAGQSYLPTDGSPTATPGTSAPAPGTVLSDDVFPAGQMPVLFQTTPPSSAAEMKQYLATTIGIEISSDAVAYLRAIRILMSEWTLSPGQHAAILSTLVDLDGLEMAGGVTDRLGRPGIAFRATSPTSPQFENLFIISRETGSILALETIYLGGLPELVLPTPSVIDYTAWK